MPYLIKIRRLCDESCCGLILNPHQVLHCACPSLRSCQPSTLQSRCLFSQCNVRWSRIKRRSHSSMPSQVPEHPLVCINVRFPPRLLGTLDRSRYAGGTYVPIWKPLENLRATFLRVRMRPVPVVFLRLAFSLHSTDLLSVSRVQYLAVIAHTLSDLSSGEAAGRAGALLNMP